MLIYRIVITRVPGGALGSLADDNRQRRCDLLHLADALGVRHCTPLTWQYGLHRRASE